MSQTKTPRVLIAIAILALLGAVLVAGCGGSGGTTTSEQGPPPGANTPEATEEEPAEESEPAEATQEEEPAEEAESSGATEEEPTEGEPEPGAGEEEGGEPEGGAAAATEEGKTIFTSNCGSCHTLAAAGTSGEVGPNLDELRPSESRIEKQVINGGGPMPAFGKEGILSPEEVKTVAAYVFSVAGSE